MPDFVKQGGFVRVLEKCIGVTLKLIQGLVGIAVTRCWTEFSMTIVPC